ncbi:MAG: hypothetical protein IPM66_10915 [Acidobacteriota bacterium]|nr:MAG: hypothetical protein IPM66_10915 [Acidobacteriota bacterium]
MINPKLSELERRQEELQTTVAYMRGELDEVKRLAGGTARQTIWQFVIFSVTMGAILLGGIRYQTETLRNEFNGKFDKIDLRFVEMEKRTELTDKRMNQRMDEMDKRLNQRMDQMEKNILARFEDLKQEVRSRR